jgi:hypothetical protein
MKARPAGKNTHGENQGDEALTVRLHRMSFSLKSCSSGLRPPHFRRAESAAAKIEHFKSSSLPGITQSGDAKFHGSSSAAGMDTDGKSPRGGRVCRPASTEAHRSRGRRARSCRQHSLAHGGAPESEDGEMRRTGEQRTQYQSRQVYHRPAPETTSGRLLVPPAIAPGFAHAIAWGFRDPSRRLTNQIVK